MVHVDSSDPGDTQSGFGLSTGSLIGPIQLYGNTDLLGLRGCGAGTLSWVKTGCVAHGHFCLCYTSLYTDHDTDTRCVTALQSYTAIQRYTALYSAIHYTAIHRYTLYNLYNTPLGVHTLYRLTGHGFNYLYYSTFESLSNSPFAVCDRLSRHTSVRRVRVRAFFIFTVKGADESALGGGSVA